MTSKSDVGGARAGGCSRPGLLNRVDLLTRFATLGEAEGKKMHDEDWAWVQDDEWAWVEDEKDGQVMHAEPPNMLDCHYSVEVPPPLPPWEPAVQESTNTITTNAEKKAPSILPVVVSTPQLDRNRPLPPVPTKRVVVPLSIGLGAMLAKAIKTALKPARQTRRAESRRIAKKKRRNGIRFGRHP